MSHFCGVSQPITHFFECPVENFTFWTRKLLSQALVAGPLTGVRSVQIPCAPNLLIALEIP